MKPKLGAVTIGQSPREDVIPEMSALLPGVELHEAGALDGVDQDTLAALAANPRGGQLVTRLRDGTEIRAGEDDLLPRLSDRVAELARLGAPILVLCTGSFPGLTARVPLLFPDRVLAALTEAVAPPGRLAVITPGEGQLAWQARRWTGLGGAWTDVEVRAASPYRPDWSDALDAALDELAATAPAMAVLDCIGYTEAMRSRAVRRLGVPVLLARSVLARAAAELLALGPDAGPPR